jgi:hypothetical protein
VPGHMRIEGNEIADYLARESSSHPQRTWVCTWNICKGCQGSNWGLDKQETWGAFAVHTWTKAG